MGKKIALYCVINFIIIFGVTAFQFGKYLYVQDILKEPVYATARIIDINKSTNLKKGFSTSNYSIVYEFDHDTNSYTGEINVSSGHERQYKNANTVEIVYKRSNPNKSILKTDIGYDPEYFDWGAVLAKACLFSLLISLLPFGIVAFLLGWIKLK